MTTSTSSDRTRVTLRTPDDVLAKVPFLVGFHPQESLVVLAFGPDQQLLFTLRVDLPDEAEVGLSGSGDRDVALSDDCTVTRTFVRPLVRVVRTRGASRALLVAYTSSREAARPVLRATHRTMAGVGIEVLDLLVADGRRWWSDACDDAGCCPPTGNPYDLASHPVTVSSVFAGEVALADEDAVRRSLAPVEGPSRKSMQDMTARVLAEMAERFSDAPDRVAATTAAGRRHVVDLLRRRGSDPAGLSDRQVAEASVFVSDLDARDAIWRLVTKESARLHVALWSEVCRRAVKPYDVAPATLLAFAAWLGGEGALARCALERAIASNPDYPMAGLVEELLIGVVPPEAWLESEWPVSDESG